MKSLKVIHRVPALYKVFEKYKMGIKAILCWWYDGQLNITILSDPSLLAQP